MLTTEFWIGFIVGCAITHLIWGSVIRSKEDDDSKRFKDYLANKGEDADRD